MSNQWIRGSRCGVDNCRSRYYRSVDGRRICQYGHVNEGHLEINDEEDDAGAYVLTRRLKIPGSQGVPQQSQLSSSQKDEKRRKVYGIKATELYFKSFQAVLRAQVMTLIHEQNMPALLETVVKRLWIQYIGSGLNCNDGLDTGFSNPETAVTGTDTETSMNDLRKLPKFIDSLALCYLACRHLQLPIYLNDFVTWTTTNRVPYMKGIIHVPKSIRQRLPIHIMNLFEPRRPPIKGDLCLAVANLVNLLDLRHLTLNYEPLLLKIVTEMILPPQIYVATSQYIKQQNIKFTFPTDPKQLGVSIRNFPEIKLIALVIVITKLFNLHSQQQGTTFNWKKWMNHLQNMNLSPNDNRNFNNLLASLLLSDKQDVIAWDESKMNKYLDWFSQSIAQPQLPPRDDLPVALRRLYDIFPLPNDDGATTSTADELQIDDLKLGYQDLLTFESVAKREISTDELDVVEHVLCENVIKNFGLTKQQLRQCVRFCEVTLMSYFDV